MPDLMMSACLQNIHETDEIAFDIGMWIRQGVPNARLGRQVDHDVKLFRFEQP